MSVYRITFRHADTGTEQTANFEGASLVDAVGRFDTYIARLVAEHALRPTQREVIAAELAVRQ